MLNLVDEAKLDLGLHGLFNAIIVTATGKKERDEVRTTGVRTVRAVTDAPFMASYHEIPRAIYLAIGYLS
jgi:hypothetical protein